MARMVIALGQSAASDDGVGVAVLGALRAQSLPTDVTLHHLRDVTGLVTLLEAHVPIVLIDAVLAEPPGQVLELSPDKLAAYAPLRVSSHGLGVAEAIGLASALNDGAELPPIHIVAVSIDRPKQYEEALSPAVAAAVPKAAARVLSLLENDHA